MQRKFVKSIKPIQSAVPTENKVINTLIDISINPKRLKWELFDDIVVGRKLFDMFNQKLLENQLMDLVQDQPSVPSPPDPVQSWEEYMMNQNVKKPKKFNEIQFSYRWAIMEMEEFQDLPMKNPSQKQFQDVMETIAILPVRKKNKLEIAKDEEKKRIDKETSENIKSIRSLEETYNDKVTELNKNIEMFKKDKILYEEKVKTMYNLMNTFFSDNVIKLVKDDLEKKNYGKAIQLLKSIIFKGTESEGEYLLTTLEETKYDKNMNFVIFIQSIEFIFTMLHECGMTRSDKEKLRLLEKFIMKGNHIEFQESIKTRKRIENCEYGTLLITLNNQYDEIRLNHTIADTPRANQSSVYNAVNNNGKLSLMWCNICARHHRGPHDDDNLVKRKRNDDRVNQAKDMMKRPKKASYFELEKKVNELMEVNKRLQARQAVEVEQSFEDFMKSISANMVTGDNCGESSLCLRNLLPIPRTFCHHEGMTMWNFTFNLRCRIGGVR
jgi:hypothetical protein